jgi:DNA modification methylase
MAKENIALTTDVLESLRSAALHKNRVSGLTHNFYRYPARFSPTFARTAIKLFSKPGDTVLDPYMGGGTTIVEAIVAGRLAIGTDLNSLSVFITKVKTTHLTGREQTAVARWARDVIPQLNYRYLPKGPHTIACSNKTKNLTLPRARFIKKVVANALACLSLLPTQKASDFVRCAVLKTAQWALDGRKTHTSLSHFRARLSQNIEEMLSQLTQLDQFRRKAPQFPPRPVLLELDAACVHAAPIFSTQNARADLVVTSPPYPGLHVLYHRWQVDGRRETPAPYWITGCQDGQGDSYYNFGSRYQRGLESYFQRSLKTLKAIRKVVQDGAFVVQMVAFSRPQEQLPRYLDNMTQAAFEELSAPPNQPRASHRRIWRDVPNRRWHATLRGQTSASREVVLVHIAN